MTVFQSMDAQDESVQTTANEQWQNQSKPKGFTFWQEYRRSNPRSYYSAKTQKVMLEHSQQLGENFFDNKAKEKWDE